MIDTDLNEDNRRPDRPHTCTDDGQQHPAASGTGQLVSLPRLALLVATVLVGLSAGFFFTYEASVTLGLADVSDLTYVEAFRAINDAVRNPAFGLVFFGSIPALALAATANWRPSPPLARALLAAAVPLYLTGLIITGTGNVPLNNELGDVENLTTATAAITRAGFEDDWNQLNLLRSIAVGASFACLVAASALLPARNDSSLLAGETGRS